MAPPILDPQIRAVLDEQAAAGVPSVDKLTPEEARANYAKVCAEQWGELEEMASIENLDADGVPIRIYRPVETKEPSMALVYFHGGGWVVGSIDTHDGPCRALAKRAGIAVVSVDYRLAPENPWPAAVDDAWAATQWVSTHASDLGIDADHLGVGGDSAGGTLAAVVARRSRDHAVPLSLQLLIYPVTSVKCDTSSYSLFAEEYGLTRDAMQWYWKQYLGESDGMSPDASPAELSDLRRLPRAIVVTAEADVLRDEAEMYAHRMFLSTVETEGYRYDGMIHGFMRMAGKVERSNKAYDEIAQSVKELIAKDFRDLPVSLNQPSAAE